MQVLAQVLAPVTALFVPPPSIANMLGAARDDVPPPTETDHVSVTMHVSQIDDELRMLGESQPDGDLYDGDILATPLNLGDVFETGSEEQDLIFTPPFVGTPPSDAVMNVDAVLQQLMDQQEADAAQPQDGAVEEEVVPAGVVTADGVEVVYEKGKDEKEEPSVPWYDLLAQSPPAGKKSSSPVVGVTKIKATKAKKASSRETLAALGSTFDRLLELTKTEDGAVADLEEIRNLIKAGRTRIHLHKKKRESTPPPAKKYYVPPERKEASTIKPSCERCVRLKGRCVRTSTAVACEGCTKRGVPCVNLYDQRVAKSGRPVGSMGVV